jgi:hypothetical protein
MKRFYLTTLIALLALGLYAHSQSSAASTQQPTRSVSIGGSPIAVIEAAFQQDDTADQITIKNNDKKTVTAIDWQLVLTGEASGKELSIALRFHNSVKIRPGEMIGLNEKVFLAQEELTNLSKRVMILRIQYEDGTSFVYPK